MANQHIEQKQQATNSFSSKQEGSFEFRWKSFLRTTINQKAISSSFYASNLLRQSNFDREMSRQKEEPAYRDQIAVKLISAAIRLGGAIPRLRRDIRSSSCDLHSCKCELWLMYEVFNGSRRTNKNVYKVSWRLVWYICSSPSAAHLSRRDDMASEKWLEIYSSNVFLVKFSSIVSMFVIPKNFVVDWSLLKLLFFP